MKKKTKGSGPAAWLRENKWTCIVLAAALGAAGMYLGQSTARVDTALQTACVLAQNGQYKTSAAAYREAAAEAEHSMRLWGLLV